MRIVLLLTSVALGLLACNDPNAAEGEGEDNGDACITDRDCDDDESCFGGRCRGAPDEGEGEEGEGEEGEGEEGEGEEGEGEEGEGEEGEGEGEGEEGEGEGEGEEGEGEGEEGEGEEGEGEGEECELPLRFLADVDQDTFGDPARFIDACAAAGVFTAVIGGDCDDDNSAIHPDATELFATGVDEDCDGDDDDDRCDADGAPACGDAECEDAACNPDAPDADAAGCTATVTPGAPCDDDDPCTEDDSCRQNSGCAGEPLDIDDDNACTVETCTAGGVVRTPVDASDDNDCTVDSCDPATGDLSHTPVDVDDELDCTIDACGPGGVTHTADDSACGFAEVCSLVRGCDDASFAGRVVITELQLRGGFVVELHNPSAAAVDLSGFTLRTSRGDVAAITGAPPLAPGGFLFGGVGLAADFTLVVTGSLDGLASGAQLRLDGPAGPEDLLTLNTLASAGTPGPEDFVVDDSGERSSQVDPAAATADGNNTPSAWCVSFPATNTFGGTNPSCRQLVISEVQFDAGGSGSDDGKVFVEVRGPGGATVAGLRVRGRGGLDGGAVQAPNVTFAAGLRLPVDGFLVIADGTDAVTTAVPNADIILAGGDPQNGADDGIEIVDGVVVLDRLGYGVDAAAFAEGTPAPVVVPVANGVSFSLARDESSTDSDDNRADFHLDPTPTPGQANDAVVPTLVSIEPAFGPAFAATAIALTTRDVAGFSTIDGDNSDRSPAFTVGTASLGQAVLPCTVAGQDGATGIVTWSCLVPDRLGAIPQGIVGDVAVQNPAALGGGDVVVGGFTWQDGSVNETSLGVEADFCNLQFQTAATVGVGGTVTLFSQFFEAGLTDVVSGQAPGVKVEVGTLLSSGAAFTVNDFSYSEATFNPDGGNANNDEYGAVFSSLVPGTFRWLFRYSLDDGLNWTHCDDDGAGSNGNLEFSVARTGTIVVSP